MVTGVPTSADDAIPISPWCSSMILWHSASPMPDSPAFVETNIATTQWKDIE